MAEPMSIWSLIADATLVVKLVMLILLAASIMSWYVIWQKKAILARAKASLFIFEEQFWSGIDLSRLFVQVNKQPSIDSGAENIFTAGFKEFARLRKNASSDPDAVMQGSERAMRVALLREQEKLDEHLSFLATVGSTSPYIGLFGTVWGIMNSFISLANEQQATLAVVAPGIAEALIATAIGLFAAIPAAIFYNRFSSSVDQVLHKYETFSDEFSGILHRKAHANDDSKSSEQ